MELLWHKDIVVEMVCYMSSKDNENTGFHSITQPAFFTGAVPLVNGNIQMQAVA